MWQANALFMAKLDNLLDLYSTFKCNRFLHFDVIYTVTLHICIYLKTLTTEAGIKKMKNYSYS